MLHPQPDTEYPVVVSTMCVSCGKTLIINATSNEALPVAWETDAECPNCWSK
jgi:hypothetical protein